MGLSFLVFFGVGLLLVLLLLVLLRDPEKASVSDGELASSDESGRHVAFFPQIRQALAPEDYTFLTKRSGKRLSRRIRKDRRRIALAYLAQLRKEFTRLWKLARMIAAMSPNVSAAREVARFQMGVGFYLRYEAIRLRFILGLGPIPDVGAVSEVVSNLAIRLETAISNLGERAALAGELASALDRSGLHTR